uniref:Poly(ADP-ribose) glycohydrolase n=1 Tax=Macrostomum lignano TaxID=282301 RepID=A0A1I8FTI8_9PLAT
LAHYETTGPEIWEETEGRVDAVAFATGTGERNPDVRTFLLDPEGSGIGQGRVTQNLSGAPVDHALHITDAMAVEHTFRLLHEEGFFVGASSGINVAGAVQAARQMGPGHVHKQQQNASIGLLSKRHRRVGAREKAGESSNPPPASLNRSDTDPVASADPEQQQSQVKRVPTDDSVTSSATEPIAEEEAEETETDDNDEESQRCRDWRRQLEALRPEPNLARLPFSCPPRAGHSVLFRIDNFYEQARSSQPPQPWPTEFSDRWDSGHNALLSRNASRWSAIEHSLNQLKSARSIGIDDLATVLNVCSGRRQSSLCLDSLNCLLTEELGRGEMRHFLNRVLPGMVRLALALPHLVTTPPPLLRCGYQLKLELNCCLICWRRRGQGHREDDGAGMLEVDFANAYIGGGCWARPGAEIRFLICPELLLSRLLAESLEDGEALWITGAGTLLLDYTGYSSTFQWKRRSHRYSPPRDTNRRLVTKLVAIDARCYSRGAAGYKQQFNKSAIDRELHKALVGFGGPANVKHKSKRRPVATGNWVAAHSVAIYN